METSAQSVKMTAVHADQFESIGYEDGNRCLYIKLRDGSTVRFDNVPRFRIQGLLAAPRKDAYYKSFIKDQFVSKTMPG